MPDSLEIDSVLYHLPYSILVPRCVGCFYLKFNTEVSTIARLLFCFLIEAENCDITGWNKKSLSKYWNLDEILTHFKIRN